MNSILLIILFLLMIIIGGKRGLKSFTSLMLNFIVLMLAFILISIGINPLIVTIALSLITSLIILYYVNGKNIKTNSSFISIMLVYIILILGILFITKATRIGGFGIEELDEIYMYSYNISINMNNIAASLILIGLIGAITDTSVAISSALYEIKRNNENLNRNELFKSGITIGKDILGTTVNTLLFAFLGEFMTLLIWFQSLDYSITETINSKVFAGEFIKILFSNLGCILIIPITAYVISYNLTKRTK